MKYGTAGIYIFVDLLLSCNPLSSGKFAKTLCISIRYFIVFIIAFFMNTCERTTLLPDISLHFCEERMVFVASQKIGINYTYAGSDFHSHVFSILTLER